MIIYDYFLRIYKNYVNLMRIHLNSWIINNVLIIKNVFTTIRVVWASGGSGLKPQNDQFKVF